MEEAEVIQDGFNAVIGARKIYKARKPKYTEAGKKFLINAQNGILIKLIDYHLKRVNYQQYKNILLLMTFITCILVMLMILIKCFLIKRNI